MSQAFHRHDDQSHPPHQRSRTPPPPTHVTDNEASKQGIRGGEEEELPQQPQPSSPHQPFVGRHASLAGAINKKIAGGRLKSGKNTSQQAKSAVANDSNDAVPEKTQPPQGPISK